MRTDLRAEAEPPRDCPLCPRLVAYRAENRVSFPDWWNGPAPSFGSTDARLLVVGLAPGLRGANRTGRPFTGDWAGELLYPTLARFGFSEGRFDPDGRDDLRLVDAMISNAVRCAPPQNKPSASEEAACRPFLAARIASLPRLEVVIALGRVAHENVLRALGLKPAGYRFAHAAEHRIDAGGRRLVLFDSYHCSRYNTNTGRLTEAMFHAVFAAARTRLDGQA